MAVVVDASVGLKWVLKEHDSFQALALLASNEELLVPDFWLNEATNIVWVQVRKDLWTPAQARQGLALLQAAVTPTLTADLALHEVALEIALAVDHSPYDCLYAAFAVAMGADHLIVADGLFLKSMSKHREPKLARLLLSLDGCARGAGVVPAGGA